jgi:hypothetical protein
MDDDVHVLGLSGGKDSAALALYMREKHPDLNIQYFFTDTGHELAEVYKFMSRLSGLLNKEIIRLEDDRYFKHGNKEKTPFEWWLRVNHYFLPSAQQRWCTVKLKLDPFKRWIAPFLQSGKKVIQYVAIRSDEDHREGLKFGDPRLVTRLPFRENQIDRNGVQVILENAGIGLPKYYEWRSRSGCSFCFFQQKIEWVRLLERYPDLYEQAASYEKLAVEHDSPFTWSEGESLQELRRPERVIQIKEDYSARRNKAIACKAINPLQEGYDDIDEIYDEEEGGGACLICHK